MLIWPEASNAQNSMAAVSAEGNTVWVLIRRLNSSCSPLDCVRSPRASPLARRKPGECEQALAGFLQAVGDGAMFEPPLSDEGLAADQYLLGRRRVDHVAVVGADLLVQALRGMSDYPAKRIGDLLPWHWPQTLAARAA